MQNFVNSLKYRRIRRTTLIAVGAAAFLAGLGLAQIGAGLYGWHWLVVALLLLVFCLAKKALVAVPVVLVAGLIAGVWRGSEELAVLRGYQAQIDQKVIVVGSVVEDPTYDDKGMLDFRLQNIELAGQKLPGQVRIKTYSLIDARRGDTLRASGKLVDGFGNYQAAIYYAVAEPISWNQSFVDDFRRDFAASVLTNIPEPQASLGLGFLVGLKTGLPDELSEQMKILGLTHIVVASGYNLTILVRLARRVFSKVSKFQTAAVGGAMIAGFVAVTGFSPSMSRAALVTGLALLAWYYGRRVHPVTLILFAAAITAAINPILLWSDIGWWLSFLAFTGVLVLAPLVQRRLFGDKQPKLIGQIVLETICAQVLTLPLILFVFGDFSVLAVVANVLLVPLVPLAMLLTFLSGVAGLLAPGLAPIVALPATVLMSFMTEVVRLLAQIPWAQIPLGIALPVMLGFYAATFVFGFIAMRRTKFSFLKTSVVE